LFVSLTLLPRDRLQITDSRSRASWLNTPVYPTLAVVMMFTTLCAAAFVGLYGGSQLIDYSYYKDLRTYHVCCYVACYAISQTMSTHPRRFMLMGGCV
jgi:hypothetical protein